MDENKDINKKENLKDLIKQYQQSTTSTEQIV